METTSGVTKNKLKKLYTTGIILTLIFGLGHIAYTFLEYKKLNEPALWFFVGALATLYNAGLNFINLELDKRLTYLIAVSSNAALTAFCIVLAIVSPEVQTISITLIIFYITIISIIYAKT